MILIADGGSTKTCWSLINENMECGRFTTEGYNPFFVDAAYITHSLHEALPSNIDPDSIEVIHYYGAGVHDDTKAQIIKDAFAPIFKNSEINVGHDLLAAARATLGNKPGFVAILGTGTNSCIFDGGSILHNIESGGYLIGDEGSGAHIGKHLLLDYVRQYLPAILNEKFVAKYNLYPNEILDKIYTRSLTSRFLASFCEFVGENIHHEYCHDLVKSSFVDFFESLVSYYPGYKNYLFTCIGSVGYAFKSILEDTALEFGMKTGGIISSPMDGLIRYHTVSNDPIIKTKHV